MTTTTAITPVRSPYRGLRTPVVRCREVSGHDCDEPMLLDAEHCGNPLHRRLVPAGAAVRGRPDYIRRHRPSLVVDEEYELLDGLGSPTTLDRDTFDPAEVWISRGAQHAFTSFHGVSAEVAIEEVRLVLRNAIQGGRYRQKQNGKHVFSWKGFTVMTTPDLTTATNYLTNHHRRTPSMVTEGVPSEQIVSHMRAHRMRTAAARPSIPDTITVGATLIGVVTSVVQYGLFIEVEGVVGLAHVSNLANVAAGGAIPHTVGDTVLVEVIQVDPERKRFSLRELA